VAWDHWPQVGMIRLRRANKVSLPEAMKIQCLTMGYDE